MSYTVGQVAEIAGVTVRTLHHYDEVGLLSPDGRTPAGYRQYSAEDVERLHQILMYRELGFALEEIVALVTDEASDATVHLRRQHELLLDRMGRLQTMVAAVQLLLEAEQMGISLTPEERFEVFGNDDPAEHADEAEQRWGESGAYKESRRRTTKYSKDDWKKINAATAAIEARWVAALDAGEPATSERAMNIAQEHRDNISRWFYDVPVQMHRGLADMYVSDPRFTAYYEKLAPGLASYAHDAIHANADRSESGL
jgi:MerR family transcriptional regulator, thiopeptide resistance regulator